MARIGRPVPAIGPGAPFTWPGAFSQFPLPLKARAGGAEIIRVKARANADKTPEAIFIVLLHIFKRVRSCFAHLLRVNLHLFIINAYHNVNSWKTPEWQSC